ncbi:TonB-dependent receptor [Nitrospirillum iridis]|uniref:Iron complex outermembrane receptor protein n=1 Tax=Nitrospirillum iridis TaxID=765888 RepID=A0A7X0B0T1_9PROT|nr:TonB-dependent receptor [Nitrospirillum iridis]MBB6253262.1 iron complex outermembrane receptor protein [Nitrospirillum iridis]
MQRNLPLAIGLLVATSGAALVPAFATAQEATPPMAGGGQEANSASALEEIIVTAERRVSNIQRTPISIAVKTGADLAQTGTVDLAKAVEDVPAVQVQKSNTGASFYIRGIGSRGVGGSSPVSVNEDGIYQQQPDLISGAFADLDRIEVLRGPQGTLYGRNANGGTVNVITKNPDLDGYSGDVTVGFGNYDTVQSQAVLNAPLGPTLAIRIVGDLEQHSGYLTNGLSDRDDKVLRGKALWKPNDRFSLLVSAEEFFTDSRGPGNVLISAVRDNPWYSAPYDSFAVVFTGDPVFCSPNCQPYYRVRNKQYRAEANYDLGFATLTALTGIQRYRRHYLQAFAGGLEYDDQPLDQESYELRLTSNEGAAIKWVAGAYALNQDYSGETKYVYHIDSATYYAINKDSSRAAFGQASVPLTDDLSLTGGVRYTQDHYDKRLDDGTVDGSTGVLESLTTGTLHSKGYAKVTYKGALEYQLDRASMLYAQYSTGFRSGGVDENGATFGPETIKAFEVGSKNRFFDDRLQLNASAYYYRYGGYQLDYIVSVGGASTDQITTSNVPGTTKVWGTELETQFRASHADLITASVSYEGSEFSDVTLATSCTSAGVCSYTDLGGRSLPRTPRWTLNGGYEHTFDIDGGDTITTHVDTQYKSAYDADLISFTHSRQGAYALFNARLTYSRPDWGVSVSAYVNNITNRAVLEQANTAGPVNRYGVLNDPRTFGLVLNGHF